MSSERPPQPQVDSEDAAAVRFPPPLVALIAVGLGIGLNVVWPLGLVSSWPVALRYGTGAAVVLGALFGLGLWSVVLFRRGGQSELPWTPTPSIEEGGPYRFTRNPMYLMMVLICAGLGVLLDNAWLVALAPIVGWIIQRIAILPEEAYLERKFGDAYLDYKKRVRRWI